MSFWLVQIGFNVTFLGMFMVGLEGSRGGWSTTAASLHTGNLISTIGAYFIGVGMLVLLYDVVASWRHGEPAPMNPWGAKTLEWTVPNPIPLENFAVPPGGHRGRLRVRRARPRGPRPLGTGARPRQPTVGRPAAAPGGRSSTG